MPFSRHVARLRDASNRPRLERGDPVLTLPLVCEIGASSSAAIPEDTLDEPTERGGTVSETDPCLADCPLGAACELLLPC